jgi:hypothetical protein
MSVITGTFIDGGIARVRVPISFTYQSAPSVAGTFGVTSRVPVTTETNEVGAFSVTLAMGDWLMHVDNSERYIISVPNDSASYDFIARIVSAVTQSPTEPLAGAGICIAQNEVALKNSYAASTANRLAILYSPTTANYVFWRWDGSSSAAESTSILNPTGNTGDGRWIRVAH